ncbi:MAG: DUF2442 domain-containing protein [Aquificae bacterium]|nr:DUF2442 domain-containing protein [Aquificota bacterium]
MSTSRKKSKIIQQMEKDDIPLAEEVWFDKEYMYVKLKESKIICVPIDRFPKLKKATKKQRENYRLIGHGYGIHWEELDEDIQIETLFYPENKLLKAKS